MRIDVKMALIAALAFLTLGAQADPLPVAAASLPPLILTSFLCNVCADRKHFLRYFQIQSAPQACLQAAWH